MFLAALNVDFYVELSAFVVVTVIAFGLVGTAKNTKFAQLAMKVGRIVGPVGIICMFISAGLSSSARNAEPDWQRYTTQDGICSAELPAEPSSESGTKLNMELDGLIVNGFGGNNYYLGAGTLTQGDFDGRHEKIYSALRTILPKTLGDHDIPATLESDSAVHQDGVSGHLYVLNTQKLKIKYEVFFFNKHAYIVSAAFPPAGDAASAERMLKSVAFKP